MPIRILIADDHEVMRAGLRAMLEDEPDHEVVGEAASGEEALRLANLHQPDILLCDIGMPGMDGIEVTRQLKQQNTHTQVLILSVYEDGSLLREAIKAGASGYIIKRAVEDELLAAIRAVSRGDMYIHPAITRLLVKDLSPTDKPKKGALETLTPRAGSDEVHHPGFHQHANRRDFVHQCAHRRGTSRQPAQQARPEEPAGAGRVCREKRFAVLAIV